MAHKYYPGQVLIYKGQRVVVIQYAINHTSMVCHGKVPKEIVAIEYQASKPIKRDEVCEEDLESINRP